MSSPSASSHRTLRESSPVGSVTEPEGPADDAARDSPRQRRRVWWTIALLSAAALALAGAVRFGALGAKTDAAGGPSSREPTVRVATAEQSTISLSMEQRGDLDAEVAELSSQVTGRLTQIRFDLGDHFKRGDLLARIDASLAQHQIAEARTQEASADASLERAEAELAAAEIELDRSKKLRAEQLISQRDLDARSSAVAVARAQVSTAQAQRKQAAARVSLLGYQASETRLTAPFDGSVAARYLDPGALVQPGSRVLRLVQQGPLRVEFRVPERDMGHVKIGMRLEVTTQATGDQRYAGKVTRRSAEVSRLDRSVTVKGVLDTETPQLLPGMYATVHLELGRLENVVVVPSAAVAERELRGGQRTGVYRVEAGVARWQEVTVRGTSGDVAAVTPLAVGTRVITLGPDTLRDGMKVRVAKDDEK